MKPRYSCMVSPSQLEGRGKTTDFKTNQNVSLYSTSKELVENHFAPKLTANLVECGIPTHFHQNNWIIYEVCIAVVVYRQFLVYQQLLQSCLHQDHVLRNA